MVLYTSSCNVETGAIIENCHDSCKITQGCTFYNIIRRTPTGIDPCPFYCKFSTGTVDYDQGYITNEGRGQIQGVKSVKIRSQSSSRNLESNQNGDVYSFDSSYSTYQVWTIYRNDDGTFSIKNSASGKYLDSAANGFVYTLERNSGKNQKWINNNLNDNNNNNILLTNVETKRNLAINQWGVVSTVEGTSADTTLTFTK